jgi:hydroxymethylpyrimidine pyrophosphatase-like HAD family hydrolase
MVKTVITWNKKVKLIISDIDETIAEVYKPAQSEIITELNKLINDGIRFFFISGQGFKNICERVIKYIDKRLRKNILIGYCNGAEVTGFSDDGEVLPSPFYSIKDRKVSGIQIATLREIVKTTIQTFSLELYPPLPVHEFIEKTKGNPFSVIFEDRELQITLDVVNGYVLRNVPEIYTESIRHFLEKGITDLRLPLVEYSTNLLIQHHLPFKAFLGGQFAIDYIIKDISKGNAIKAMMGDAGMLKHLGLDKIIFEQPELIEIWGDQFSQNGDSDVAMCRPIPLVRAINFRKIKQEELVRGLNIQIWDREKVLQDGVLDYMLNR